MFHVKQLFDNPEKSVLMNQRILAVLLIVALLLAGCGGMTAPSETQAAKPSENVETKPAPAQTTTAAAPAQTTTAAAPAPTVSFVKTEWECDYILDENGQKLMIADLLSEGKISETFRVRFYENGYVYVDYLRLDLLRGSWMGYDYSEENGLAIDFPADQTNSYTLISASAEAIELRNVEGQLFHFIPAPYGG